ncbi:Retrovirus-related Pol polyprotein from transposon 17.6 [Hypsizygus marmoreus]|uniref:Retrovirus-related Pol polyprotein from transposon 17.6 n=1 Tax=Hypsizygus marmoreus TaxID=39966 RepID=A0A369J1G3_HYPMA|nr:Retrovirus-related Pol polyprotein from transposon 17.6 [Hypsizygus marmoreus]
MPDASNQTFQPVTIPQLPPLSLNPPLLENFVPTERLTRERLDTILSSVPAGFLQPREIDLLVDVLRTRELGLAFVDSEHGTFSDEFYPDYKIPVIEHTPWVQDPIRIPKSIEGTVREMLTTQKAAGKYEPSTASYRSRIFAVAKKGGIRLVADVQELNRVTVRDSGLPPRTDDFAEGFVGCVVYGLADLFSGYDGHRLGVISRPLTTFNSLIGPLRSCVLPQGATNSVPEFQKCTTHMLQPEIPKNGDVFIDDVGIKGPTSAYDNEEIVPGIRRFLYEYATILDRFFARFIAAGITASGKKLVLATPRLHIVGTIVSHEGWHMEHGLISKIMNWPIPRSVTDVRSFLGTAGVGRKWIKGFSLIAKPLTLLTRNSDTDFFFDDNALTAMNSLKKLVSSAPVLVKIDYDAAKLISPLDPLPRASDHGLVIVAVDSCTNGAGWILYQMVGNEKHPALFGSCTFNDAESRYSQPKCELYGVFRAFKDLRHRIWGIPFRLDVDAKFLTEMIRSPDLPNAPMTRWILYLLLFDFKIQHVPAISHQGPDGLSRRKHTPEDSDDEDAEGYLDNIVNQASYVRSPLLTDINTFSMTYFDHCIWDGPGVMEQSFLRGIMEESRPLPRTPYGSFGCTPFMEDLSVFATEPIDSSQPPNLDGYHGMSIDPDFLEPQYQNFSSLANASLLRCTNDLYVGHEFEHRKVASLVTADFLFGDDVVSLEYTDFRRSFMSGPRTDAPRFDFRVADGVPQVRPIFDHRENYEDIPPDFAVTCATHKFGIKDFEDKQMWDDLSFYLANNVIPDPYKDDPQARSKFIRKSLIAEAHNDAGHRGRDATYTTLTDRYYWPNMYDDVAYFVHSCNTCQLRAKARPKVPFEATWSTALLRCFDFDTVHMETGYGGLNYILQAIEPTINWIEARGVRHNTSEAWASFIYQDLICRFGCIPYGHADGGSEFKGAVELLFKQYGVEIIISAPYHPQASGSIERAHNTFVESLLRACGKDSNLWPLYIHACLFAIRCTTSRVTGYTPYFLLYGRHPFFAFDLADRTWDLLDWGDIRTTMDLIAVRTQQILQRDKKLALAQDTLKASRQRAVDDFYRKHEKYLSSGRFGPGTWVLVQETWLDAQKGNKGALRWSGPYIVHRALRETTYQLRELDGTVRRESYAAMRLKIFYYREEHQTIRTVDYTTYAPYEAASTCGPDVATLMFNINYNPRVTAPPHPMSITTGPVFYGSNTGLEYQPIYLKEPTIKSVQQYSVIPKWDSRHQPRITLPESEVCLVGVDELVSWSAESFPLR